MNLSKCGKNEDKELRESKVIDFNPKHRKKVMEKVEKQKIYNSEKISCIYNKSLKYDTENNRQGGDLMDWQDKYIEKVDQEITEVKSEIKNLEDRIGNKIDSKLEEFRNEMRHLDTQRAEDMREIRSNLESTNKHVQSMVSSVHSVAIAAIIGIATMVIGALGIWYSVSSSQNDIFDKLQQQSIQIQEIQNNQPKQ